MNTEDLFKYGVTPKEGKYAGEKFIVENINPCVVFCFREKEPTHKEEFTHGSYDLWHEPKTLFEDHTIPATWGNIKKAVEAAGLGDGTLFAVHDFICGFREAELRKEKLQDHNGHEKTYIIVE